MFKNVLIDDSFIQNKADPCIYNIIKELVYVVDLLVAAKNDQQIRNFCNILNNKFEINNFGATSHYLGMEIVRSGKLNYKIRQKHYIYKMLIRLTYLTERMIPIYYYLMMSTNV